MESQGLSAVTYRVYGMDCPSCAAKIRKAAQRAGVEQVAVSMATQRMTLSLPADGAAMAQWLERVERDITAMGYHLERDADGQAQAASPGHAPPPTHTSPAYRRAMWIVILLNAGYGVVQIVGGLLARSQALQADALDFIGDGLITWLGVLAIGWGTLWRARAAMVQGVFLGVLGAGVMMATLWRVWGQVEPHAPAMGVMGAIALAVNLLAAAVLIPHRQGDANVRAVWLFSRNDAIGNLAVIVAAGCVAWTGSRWPDLAVAVGIAGLFLHGACVIVRDAWRDGLAARRP